MGANVFVLSDRTFSYMSSVRKEMLSPHLSRRVSFVMNQIVFPVRVKNYTAAIFLLFFFDGFYSFAKIKQMIHVDINEGYHGDQF
jgi:hypothetical protein